MAGNYERLYDSSLLDDIHNYYPAVLYDSSRFSSVADVFAYIQEQTRNRFDLYSYGLNQYRDRNRGSDIRRSSRLNNSRPVYANHENDNYVVQFTTTDIPEPPTTVRMSSDIEAQWRDIDSIMGGNSTASSLGLITSLLNAFNSPRVPRPPSNFMSPVVVRLSEEQIENGSRVDFVGARTENQCAVCQSGFDIGEERRTLSACNHEFHRSCIDPWFHQNVHCPVCRHDIREN